MTPNFTRDELACKHCNEMLFTLDAVKKLQALRDDYGAPMKISSGYRCPGHNDEVSSTGRSGPHTVFDNDNITVDVLIHTGDAHKLLYLALKHGFAGVGINQKGLWDQRFLHLDLLAPDLGRIRPTTWSY